MINKKAQSIYVLVVILLILFISGILITYSAVRTYKSIQCTIFDTPGGCFLILFTLGVGLILYGGYETWSVIRGDYSQGKDIGVEE